MTLDDLKLNQVEVPIKIAVPKVIFLLEQINIASDTWYVNIDLINAFFFILIKDNQKSYS